MNTPPKATMTLSTEESPSHMVVRVGGSVTMTDSDALQEYLEKLTEKRIPLIILDVSAMDFICSSGLGAIISAHLKGRHYQGQIKIVQPSVSVRKLLETTRLTKLFPIYDTIEDALGG